MGTYRIVVDWQFPVGSGGGTNSWAIRTTDLLPDPVQITTVASLISNFYVAAMELVPAQSSVTWDGTVQDLTSAAPTYTPPVEGWTWSGGGGSSTYTASASMACVTWRTSLASRSGRGRTFIGPLDVAAVQTNGTLDTSALTILRDAAAALATGNAVPDDGAVGVWSETDQMFRDTVAGTVTDQVAVLRSRRG